MEGGRDKGREGGEELKKQRKEGRKQDEQAMSRHMPESNASPWPVHPFLPSVPGFLGCWTNCKMK